MFGDNAMVQSLQDVLGDEALAAFDRPGPVAHGLPSAAYISEEFYALENDRLFRNGWVFVAFAHELAMAGDAVPVTNVDKDEGPKVSNLVNPPHQRDVRPDMGCA